MATAKPLARYGAIWDTLRGGLAPSPERPLFAHSFVGEADLDRPLWVREQTSIDAIRVKRAQPAGLPGDSRIVDIFLRETEAGVIILAMTNSIPREFCEGADLACGSARPAFASGVGCPIWRENFFYLDWL